MNIYGTILTFLLFVVFTINFFRKPSFRSFIPFVTILIFISIQLLLSNFREKVFDETQIGESYKSMSENLIFKYYSYSKEDFKLRSSLYITQECNKEYWQQDFFLPSIYFYCFDSKGILLDKYHYVSY
jgi:hypothetical protein